MWCIILGVCFKHNRLPLATILAFISFYLRSPCRRYIPFPIYFRSFQTMIQLCPVYESFCILRSIIGSRYPNGSILSRDQGRYLWIKENSTSVYLGTVNFTEKTKKKKVPFWKCHRQLLITYLHSAWNLILYRRHIVPSTTISLINNKILSLWHQNGLAYLLLRITLEVETFYQSTIFFPTYMVTHKVWNR